MWQINVAVPFSSRCANYDALPFILCDKGDIDPSLATFGQKFVEFGVEDREDLALVEKKDLQSFG